MRSRRGSVQWLVVWMSVARLGEGCGPSPATRPDDGPAAKPAARPADPPAREPELPQLGRDDFNRLAVLLDRPLFWAADAKNPGSLDPDELVILGVGTDRSAYVHQGTFTPNFARTYRAMVERRRREAVARELDQGFPTLVQTDFSRLGERGQALVRHITGAARIIEELYALQAGSHHLRRCLLPGDEPSRALFRRNQVPWCRAPWTEKDPFCNACPGFPGEVSGLYPADLAAQSGFCARLASRPDAEALLDPFVVVRGSGDDLRAVPYHREWGERMKQVAVELRAAAGVLPDDQEQAFKAYLLAAARGFETNQWEAADEAWAAMNAGNSAWYLRIAPDEVYTDPCSRKAGFHVSFARIDPDSLFWQEKLNPLRQEMEKELAELIGPPYQARAVSFQMPDFIEIVLNAGDSRDPMGATIGQSLPNWGPVAVEGRGRTVVMSNLYTDADSKAMHLERARALLSEESLRFYAEDKRLRLLDIILHEAAHNFGPHSDSRIDGKRPGDVFGGPLATVLEELKAQTGSLYYLDLLVEKGVLKQEDAYRVYNHAILWCFGWISRGMFTPEGTPKAYSQVAALTVATLMQEGALTWEADQPAANSTDPGRFTIHYEKVAAAAEKLMQRAGRIKARGDVQQATKMIDELIRGKGYELVHEKEVKERVLRQPKASFTYSVTF